MRSSTHGLAGMRHRVEAAGGRFSVDSTPGGGTRVSAQLPQGEDLSYDGPPSPPTSDPVPSR
jgi:glucose-6-phosphate-specific signal transduction histidine kinase